MLWCIYTLFFYLLLIIESPISEHWVRGHPDCCPVYGVADGVHYVDIPYDKLMGMHWTDMNMSSFHDMLHVVMCTASLRAFSLYRKHHNEVGRLQLSLLQLLCGAHRLAEETKSHLVCSASTPPPNAAAGLWPPAAAVGQRWH